MNILFKYPTRERPEWFKKTLEIYYSLLSNTISYKFLITMDNDDQSMNNDEIKCFLRSKPNLRYHYGDHKSKIEAVNNGMDIYKEWDILVLVSDDMIPIVKGFDKIIVDEMIKNFPNTDGVLHFNDGFLGKDVTITLSIMGKAMYDRFGYIYHPDYKSFWCDNEFTDVVSEMKKVAYFPQVIIKHEWKGFTKVNKDKLYVRNSELGIDDGDVYAKRRNLGFPKESVL